MARVSFTIWHQTVVGTEPTPEQLRLYDSWPNLRGFSDRTQDPKIAEAIIVLALRAGSVSDRVLVLAPLAVEDWLLQQFDSAAMRCFQGCPQRYPGRAKEMINGFTQLFRKVKMTGRILQMPEEPAHWLSFGFSVDDPLPPWMPGRLLKL
jgi:hypothetical protein